VASGAPAQVPPPTFPAGSRGAGAAPASAPAAAPVNAAGPAAPAGQGASAATPPAAPGAQAGFGRGAFGGGPAPVAGYPRGYRVQVSMDGTSWGQPVAEGKGASGRMNIAFKPVQAKFIRITETETADDAPTWAMSGLKIYGKN
jgi:hypothetical protein